MRHAIDKRRDMARSILPSNHRRAAGRALAATKRAARRRYRQRLTYATAAGQIDALLDRLDPREYPDVEIRLLVQRRRSADKLNHFERWAVTVAARFPLEERLSALAAMLPKGLIGRHAVSHLVRLPGVSPDAPDWREESLLMRARRAEQQALALERLRAGITAVLVDGRHAELNRVMKAAAVGDPPAWRVLSGLHDVDAFVDDIAGEITWRRALESYLTASAVRCVE